MKLKHILIGTALVVVVAAVMTTNSLNPTEAEASAIGPGMKRVAIVESLGAFYDDYNVGQYSDCEAIVDRMNADAKVSVVCKWKMSNSSRRFWVGFDANGISVDTLFDP